MPTFCARSNLIPISAEPQPRKSHRKGPFPVGVNRIRFTPEQREGRGPLVGGVGVRESLGNERQKNQEPLIRP